MSAQQNVNATVNHLRGWLLRLKDVATEYLASYLSWFRMLDGAPDNAPKPVSVPALTITG